MTIGNIVFLVIGAILILIGILAFINPNWTRWINIPGGPRIKAIGSLITGIILIIIGLLVKFPTE